MQSYRLNDMTRGWFVGDFAPTALKTGACEVGLKQYQAGDREAQHFHKLATELTLIVTGRVRMSGREFGPGDIAVVAPGEAVDFEALEPTANVVVKVPGVLGDKYLGLPGGG